MKENPTMSQMSIASAIRRSMEGPAKEYVQTIPTGNKTKLGPVTYRLMHLGKKYGGPQNWAEEIDKFKRLRGEKTDTTVVRFCELRKKVEPATTQDDYQYLTTALLKSLHLTTLLLKEVLTPTDGKIPETRQTYDNMIDYLLEHLAHYTPG